MRHVFCQLLGSLCVLRCLRPHGFALGLLGASMLVGSSACTEASTDSDGSGGTIEPEPPPSPEQGVQVDNWCAAAAGSRAGERAFAQDFAAAHALQRLFGLDTGWISADATLAQLLVGSDPFQPSLLDSYGDAFVSACAADATADGSDPGMVSQVGTVAVIVPGFEPAQLPADINAVVIDLRELSPSADLAGTVALALSQDLPLGSRTVRHFSGLPSHDDGWTHYESSTTELPVVATGSAQGDLPLAFITPTRLSPEAATLVAGLRLAGRAIIIGHHVFAGVAESSWIGVGDRGLLIRTSSLHNGAVMWPDVIPADISTETPELYVEDVTTTPLNAVAGDVARSAIQPFDRTGWDWQTADTTLDSGGMRAGLLVGWGIFDRFFPFFDLVGREIDEQLLLSLAEVDGLADGDRAGYMKVLGRFMHDLYDGHGFYSDWAGAWPSGYLIVQIQRVAGEPVVRSSAHEGVFAGDTIVSIDGVDAADWYEEAMSRYSAASDGYRFVLATDELKQVWGSKELGLRDPDGIERTVTVEGRPWEDQSLVPWGGTFRPNGWLDDLGAANTYYVNLSGEVTPDEPAVYDAVVASIVALQQGDQLVLDMRDYPAINYYELERYFHSEPYTAPEFWFPTWNGPDDFSLVEDSWSFTPANPVWTGPIALLVSNKSVSSAENVAQMLEYLPNVVVVGQQSACTNGTVTSFWLPGNLSLTFTGMRLRNPDGTEFHGIGIVPDVDVVPTASQFADGDDPELLAAIQALATP